MIAGNGQVDIIVIIAIGVMRALGKEGIGIIDRHPGKGDPIETDHLQGRKDPRELDHLEGLDRQNRDGTGIDTTVDIEYSSENIPATDYYNYLLSYSISVSHQRRWKGANRTILVHDPKAILSLLKRRISKTPMLGLAAKQPGNWGVLLVASAASHSHAGGKITRNREKDST